MAFNFEFKVDDQIYDEPLLGVRPWESERVVDRGVMLMMGDKAPNLEKAFEEAQFEARKRIMGLDFDSEQKSVQLPPPKAAKAAAVLADPRLAPGSDLIEAKAIQVIAYWIPLNPHLRSVVGAAFRLPASLSTGHARVSVLGLEAWGGGDAENR